MDIIDVDAIFNDFDVMLDKFENSNEVVIIIDEHAADGPVNDARRIDGPRCFICGGHIRVMPWPGKEWFATFRVSTSQPVVSSRTVLRH